MTPIEKLREIMARLRDPKDGCPWDVEQNFRSIASCTIEEAYEVVDAIENNDMDNLREELGDLLLQVVFHSQMAKEAGLFDFDDVAQSIAEKLVRRHPHVFGDGAAAKTAEEQYAVWESIKAEERRGKPKPEGALSDVPIGLSALTRAYKLGKKAAKQGFDWPEIAPVFAKIQEELSELQMVLEEGAGEDRLCEELGDVLFACVNLARHLKQEPETALRATNRKFTQRFNFIEKQLAAQGKTPKDASLEEMETLWQQAKCHSDAA